MPKRFYFDVDCGDDAIRDEQGVLAKDLESAIEEVLLGLKEMRASGELEDSADWELVIRDDTGTELTRIRL